MTRHRQKLRPDSYGSQYTATFSGCTNFWQNHTFDTGVYRVIEEMSDEVNGPKGAYNSVTHTKVKTFLQGRFNQKFPRPKCSVEPWFNYRFDNPFGYTRAFDSHRVKADLAVDELDFSTLDFQANNAFNLGELLSDLDEGFVKFITSLFKPNYGNFRWGILPFISDLKSLIASVGDLTSKIAKELSTPTGMEMSIQYGLNQWPGYLTGSVLSDFAMVGYHKLEGYREVLTPFFGLANALQILLDEIGVHPDVRLVWDIIPLSFVVDYFVPIGDLLEAAHPRGWYKPTVKFTGNVSYKMQTEIRPARDKYNFVTGTSEFMSGEIYRRFHVDGLEAYRSPMKIPKWKFPSALQLFNTAYLAFTSKKAKASPVGKIKVVKWLQNH